MYLNKIIEHSELRRGLLNIIKSKKIGHAYLFSGNQGNGSFSIAMGFVREILLSNADEHNISVINSKIDEFVHPDIHFCFPVIAKETSSSFFSKWSTLIKNKPYSTLLDWTNLLEAKSNLNIRVEDIIDISRKVKLKSYESKYSIIFIWMPEKMNSYASNKFLKLLEEPPIDTIIVMVCEDDEHILPTVLSRVQNIYVKRISNQDIITKIKNKGIYDSQRIKQIVLKSNGNWQKVMELLENKIDNTKFEDIFYDIINGIYANKWYLVIYCINKIVDRYNKSEIKQFILYCSDMIRSIMMLNHNINNVDLIEFKNKKIKNFGKSINNSSIKDILAKMDESIYYIERNVNVKMTLLSIFANIELKKIKLH